MKDSGQHVPHLNTKPRGSILKNAGESAFAKADEQNDEVEESFSYIRLKSIEGKN